MNKIKKVLAATCAFALAAPMFATPVFAENEPNSKQTNVSYDNTSAIPDPDHPDQPGWAVKIPSSITLTDGNTLVNTDVELIKVHEGTLPTGNVAVSVKSANNYMLKLPAATETTPDSERDLVPYILAYNGTTMKNVVDTEGKYTKECTVGQVSAASPKIVGAATLNGTAQKTGSHSDILTYSIKSPV